MRARGIVAAAAATALLAGVVLRARSPRAPRPHSESAIPEQATEAPPLLDRMPTLAARPRLPREAASEAQAILGEETAEGAAGGAPAEGEAAGAPPAAAGDVAVAQEIAIPRCTPRDALLPAPRPDVDPSWPLFTEDEAGRRHAMRRGLRALDRLGRLRTEGAVWAADRIRRDLTEGLFLPECADPRARAGLQARIAELNAMVYTWPTALSGVTEIVRTARGDYPYRIVEERPFGSNTVLFWNLRGGLDPRRMPAGEIVLPLEPLVLFADRETRALHLLLGDAWIREFSIGVGSDRTPTRAGRYVVGRSLLDLRVGRDEPAGPLGSAWMGTYEVTFFGGRPRAWERGPSLHGTDRPDSIGRAESDGSIRLANQDATELLRWVDTRRGGAIRLYVR